MGILKNKMALRRITREMNEIRNTPTEGIVAAPINEEDLFKWKAVLDGPPDSPYEGGKFHIDIAFPENYPFKPPKCKFVTKIYHPNICSAGGICLDTLGSNWSPVLTLPKVLLSLSSLLVDPNPDDPMVGHIAREYLDNRAQYDINAKEMT